MSFLEINILIQNYRPMTTFQSYFQKVIKSVRNPGALFNQAQQTTASPASMIQQLRNINTQQMVAGGVIVAECLGFFTVGEMIGRFKLVGYRGDTGAHH
jgi:F-type H+-transporting ATPase subunit g